MATITSATSGNASAGATWVGGIAPVPGTDKVIIAHASTAKRQFFTNTTGYAIGSVNITLTGSVVAGSYVVNEGVQFAGDPNYYVISGWNSVTKVLTLATGLIQAIPAVATRARSVGHIVTIDGVTEWGDDTATVGAIDAYSAAAIMINGTVVASRTVSNSLKAVGDIIIKNNGTLDFGDINNAIPSSITADLYLNKSTVMTAGKYGLICENGGIFRMHGAAKTRNTTLTNTVAAAATSIVVGNATGWKAGDVIYIGPTERNNATITRGELATIHASYTTGTTIPLTAGLTYSHNNATAGGSPVAVSNRNSNVRIFNESNTFRSFVYVRYGSNSVSADHTYNYVESNNIYQSTNGDVYRQAIQWLVVGIAVTTPTDLVNPLTGNVFWGDTANSGSGPLTRFSDNYTITFNDTFVYAGSASFLTLNLTNGSTGIFNNLVAASTAGIAIYLAYSQGGQGYTFNNSYIYGSSQNAAIGSTGVTLTFNNCVIAGRTIPTTMLALSCTFNNCDFTDSFIANTGPDKIIGISLNSAGTMNLNNCLFKTDHFIENYGTGSFDFKQANESTVVSVSNRNNDVTAHEEWNYQGVLFRDNAQLINSKSSIRFEPRVANRARTKQFKVAASAGTPITFRFGLRFDTTYGTATPPSVTVAGLGITPQVFTAPATANTDHSSAITVTPVTTGQLTITISGQSTSASGKFWFSGMTVAPWIDWTWHYGYQFTPTIPSITVDSNIVASYATALAYTGLAWDGTELTVSANRSNQEIYDWHQAYCVANRLDPFITGTPTNMTIDGNLEINNVTLSGSGQINLGSNTLTLTGSAASSPAITYNSGANVFGNVTVSGLVANSRVRLNNVTDASQIYNAVVAGTSVSIPVTWTANKTLDLRVTNVNGLTAYLPFQAAGTLTSSLASFTVSQVLDTVYNFNAINGSTVTEFIADFPNIQVDIDDPDDVGSVRRLYAAFEYLMHSSQGIDSYFNGITAINERNYRINVPIVDLQIDNISGRELLMTDARLRRSDGTRVTAVGSDSIQMDYDDAYLANADGALGVINRNVQKASKLIPATENF